MKDMRKRIFRKADEIISDKGVRGRGVILPQTGQEDYEGIRDEIRESDRYIYMGDTDFEVGSLLTGFMGTYLVLSNRRVAAFGKCFCTRSVLERVGEAGE